MKTAVRTIVLSLSLGICAESSQAQAHWTLSGNAGVSTGNQTDGSLAWWGAVQRRLTPSVGLGFEAGRHAWQGKFSEGLVRPTSGALPFSGLSSGPNRLEHLSVTLRQLGAGRDATSAPYLTYGLGAYRQVILDTRDRPLGSDPRHGRVCLGGSMALGGAGMIGLRPGGELRLDVVDTAPGPSVYLTAAVGLHLNR